MTKDMEIENQRLKQDKGDRGEAYSLHSTNLLSLYVNLFFSLGIYYGIVQANEGHFWHVRCNRKLKNQQSLNLIAFFEILTQNILL